MGFYVSNSWIIQTGGSNACIVADNLSEWKVFDSDSMSVSIKVQKLYTKNVLLRQAQGLSVKCVLVTFSL